MKALSIRQPWAWLIVNGYKPVENRTWKTNYRGELMIHAAKKFDQEGYDRVHRSFSDIPMPKPEEFDRGGVVGAVRLVDCVPSFASSWFTGPVGFILAQPVRTDFYPYKGQQGLFEVDLEWGKVAVHG